MLMRILLFGLLEGLQYMYMNRKGSGETALMRRLDWAVAGRLYDKYPFVMCWHIYTFKGKNWLI